MIIEVNLESDVCANVNNSLAPRVYAISLFQCLPVSLNCGPDSFGLGAGFGKQNAEELIKEAGFQSVDAQIHSDVPKSVVYVCKR